MCVCVLFFFFRRGIFSILNCSQRGKASGCLASDEFLVIFKGDHILIYMYIFAIMLLLGIVLHFVSGISSPELILA